MNNIALPVSMHRAPPPLQRLQVVLDANSAELEYARVVYETEKGVLETKITELEATLAKERVEYVEIINGVLCRMERLFSIDPPFFQNKIEKKM